MESSSRTVSHTHTHTVGSHFIRGPGAENLRSVAYNIRSFVFGWMLWKYSGPLGDGPNPLRDSVRDPNPPNSGFTPGWALELPREVEREISDVNVSA